MYSTHIKNIERKSVVAERFIRTIKNKIYKHLASVSKNVYIDKLGEIVNKYNKAYHSTIKMKIIDVKSSRYFKFKQKDKKEDPRFEVGDHARIWKYENIFANGYTLNCSEEVLAVIKRVKNTVSWTQ